MKSAEFQKVETEMAPKLAAFNDEFYQNSKLFERVEAVYNSPEKAKLTPVQQRLVWLYHNRFVINGAKLNPEQKKRVAELNKELASLQTQFANNVLADEENYALVVDKKADLEGLPQSEIDAAAEAAAKAGQKGKWRFANTRSSMEPFLTYASNRALREKAFKMWTARGDNDNKNNNNKIVSKILKARLERSKLLGYSSFAAWNLANETMAKEPQAAMDLLMQVWKPAVAAAKTEVANMQELVDKEGGKFKIAPWDYRYYQEKVRKAKYDLDFEKVKPYLQLDHIREAMFWSAGKLYGMKFEKLKGIAVWNPNMSVYKVTNSSGKPIGVWYFDPYARAGKVSGAWMDQIRSQQTMDNKPILPIVTNNANFIQAKKGAPVLISWDDATTMFHEFGHAIHGLLSNVEYPTQSGTNTSRDFVEFPSQVNENFLRTPQVLKFLTDSKGHTIPKDLLAKIEKTQTFNQGFLTVEFLASGIMDMKLHLQTKEISDPVAFEKKTLKEIGMPEEIVMRHRTTQFNHLFSSEDYAAGYYGYLWAQVLSADAFEAFTETGNPYDAKVAKRMKDHILSVGNTIDPTETYRLFRGRDAKVEALLRQKGFPVEQKAAAND
jgi:peptidyl-dipeptidase Dcp